MDHNYEEAAQFIAALTGSRDAPVTLQTFTDRDDLRAQMVGGKDPLAGWRHGTLAQWWPWLVSMQERGAGAFVAVNEMDGQGRSNSHVMRSRGVWIDDDTPRTEPRQDFPTAPHIITESSRGKWHYYWLADVPDETAHKGLMARLVQDWGADPSATDYARVLRLPGTVHQKRAAQPFTVRLHALSGQPRYSFAHLCAAFPPIEGGAADSGAGVSEDRDLIAILQTGAPGMHDAAIKLIARLMARGFDKDAALAIVRGLIQSGTGAERWNRDGRDGELIRAADGAERKLVGFVDETTGGELAPLDLFAEPDTRFEFRPADYPQIIAEMAADIARRMGVDPLVPAWTAVAAAAGLISDTFRLRVKANDHTWTEAARLWLAFVGDPSTKKTPGMAAVLAPVNSLQAKLYARHAAQMAEHKQAAATAKEQKLTIPEPPPPVRIVAGDTTTEALAAILAANPQGILIVQDELSGFFGGMDAYRAAGVSKDRAFWLTAYNGGSFTVDRVSRGSIFVENASVSLVGGIQPEPMRRIYKAGDDDGLIQRVNAIPVRPATEGEDVPPNARALALWHALCDEFLAARMESEVTWPVAYRFAPDAQSIMDEARRRLGAMERSPGTDKRLASALGKAQGQLARLVLVYHLIENRAGVDLFTGSIAPSETVSAETTSKAARAFFGLLLPAAHSFYANVLGLSPTHQQARWIAGHILAHQLESITRRDIYRAYSDLRGDDGDRAMSSAMAQLELACWLAPIREKRGQVSEWRVNPLVHLQFSARAIEERMRREQERAAIGRTAKAEV